MGVEATNISESEHFLHDNPAMHPCFRVFEGDPPCGGNSFLDCQVTVPVAGQKDTESVGRPIYLLKSLDINVIIREKNAIAYSPTVRYGTVRA